MEATQGQSGLNLSIESCRPPICTVKISIPEPIVTAAYHHICSSQQCFTQAFGFKKGSVPLEYIEKNLKPTLLEHVKEFLFKYFVISFLYREVRVRKLAITGEPRLIDIYVEPHETAVFEFELTAYEPVQINEWKYLPFKAPKRKKYKDLDRQVVTFLKEEQEAQEKADTSAVAIGDWVHFTLELADDDGKSVFPEYHENFWLKIGDEEADGTLRDLFIGKKIGDTFTCINKGLQNYFNSHIDTNYTFIITVHDIVHHAFFCLDSFKYFFRLKTKKDVMQKLIEVFSYRHDLSQRRSTVEDSLKLLLSRHPFTIPTSIILRHQQSIIDTIRTSPDYQVYRMQKDFKYQVQQLAEKQAREIMFLDQLAFYENLPLVPNDIKGYINLTKRPRMKEFLYFDPPNSKLDGQETPIYEEYLKLACLREKTLNHIIYHITQ